MNPAYAIRVDHLSKRYRVGKRQRYRMLRDVLREGAVSVWQSLSGRNGSAPNTLWALDDVSLEVPAGQSLGIIGSNGAGKTTLLKILSRVTAPTRGRVRIRGRVGSLLEVGTGFHPELTGRENVYLNGAILGMRRPEIHRKFDDIVAFSEIDQYLDTPVKFYSSGMRMRLAFSVAVHLEPEVLLVDEVLAVGDVNFQNKSLTKMDEVIRGGRTILFVSHNMAAVRSLCQEAVYLERGRILYRGSVDDTIAQYLSSGRDQSLRRFHAEPDPLKQYQFLDAYLTDRNGNPSYRLPHDEPFQIHVRLEVRGLQFKLRPALAILDSQLDTVLNSYEFDSTGRPGLHLSPGIYSYEVRVPAPLLIPGQYRLSLGLVQSFARSSRTFGRVDHICPFEIFDNGSERARAFIRWRGQVAPALKWECVREAGPADGGTQAGQSLHASM